MSDLTTSRSLYRNSGASLLLALGLVLPLRAPAQSTATFADSQLDNAVRLALNKPTGALTTSDLIGLTNLTAKSAGINTLSGLESATNLLSLNLNGNYLTNLATLSTLTAL